MKSATVHNPRITDIQVVRLCCCLVAWPVSKHRPYFPVLQYMNKLPREQHGYLPLSIRCSIQQRNLCILRPGLCLFHPTTVSMFPECRYVLRPQRNTYTYYKGEQNKSRIRWTNTKPIVNNISSKILILTGMNQKRQLPHHTINNTDSDIFLAAAYHRISCVFSSQVWTWESDVSLLRKQAGPDNRKGSIFNPSKLQSMRGNIMSQSGH